MLSLSMELLVGKMVRLEKLRFPEVKEPGQAKIIRYRWVNLVVPKNWGAYFSAISGRKFDLTTVLRSCWHIEWRRRGFITSGCFKKTSFSDFIKIKIMISLLNLSKITKASFSDTLKLYNPSYAILDVNTISKQLTDKNFVQNGWEISSLNF